MSKLALLGGEKAVKERTPDALYKWPINTPEVEEVALDVIRRNKFSGTDITEQFEKEFAEWIGAKHALAFCNGTMSLHAAMFAAGVGVGDEIICTTKTYWASITAAYSLGATPVFCNILPNLSMDPDDFERRITPRTKAVMVVHYSALPADMDRIMEIARRHNIIVIEDVSHAQGGLYKGRRLGTIGDIGAMSMMSGKSLSAGECGVLVTNDRKYYERAIAFAHYDRNNSDYILESEDLKGYTGLPFGGLKGRANQLCTAIARVRIKDYDERCVTIRKAMNYFWDLLEGLPGIRAIRVDESTGSNMAGWYSPHGEYHPEELGGLSVERFTEAIRAEGSRSYAGGNFCLHTHKLFNDCNVFHTEKPTRIAFTDRDVRLDDKSCDLSLTRYCFSVPWFKQFNEEYKKWIELHASAFRKVIENYKDLLEGDTNTAIEGRWYGMNNDEAKR